MSPSNQGQVWLNLYAEDEATEISVIDGQFRVAAQGLGRLETQLDPGIYKTRATAGSQTWERLVVLPPGQQAVGIQIPPLSFATPVPLPGTAQTHEYHEYGASQESHRVHVTAGKGSAVFVFARRFTAPSAPTASPPGFQHPARGIVLLDAQGNPVADLAAQSAVESSPLIDPWAACNIAVDPGFYRLRLELPGGTTVEQTFVAAPNWQTQVFALLRAYGLQPGDERADLPGASILYTRYNPDFPVLSIGFDQSNPDYTKSSRLAELARFGLANRRAVMRRDIMDMLWTKWDNPMLGILGAHLLLLDKDPDYRLLRKVIDNLRGLLGKHPDVEALALPLGMADEAYVFETPPMLRRSWSLVLDATVARPDLVPLNTLASNIADRLWGEGPWLLWTSLAEAEVAIPRATVGKGVAVKKRESLAPSEFEAALTSQFQLIQKSKEEEPRDLEYLESKPQLDDDTVKRLVQTLGIPRSNIEKMVDRLWQRARLYESIRSEMAADFNRTVKMDKVVRQIKEIAAEGDEYVSSVIRDFIVKKTPGSRLIAVALLQVKPDPQYFPFVRDVIGGSLSAFEQYHALLAALAMLPLLTPDQKQQLVAVIEDQRGGSEGKYIRPGTDRWNVSNIILGKLQPA